MVEFTDWLELFREFDKLLEEKVILVVNEFPHLVESNTAIPSIFQKIWDSILSERDICLVLLGSSISMMENYTLGYSLTFKHVHKIDSRSHHPYSPHQNIKPLNTSNSHFENSLGHQRPETAKKIQLQ